MSLFKVVGLSTHEGQTKVRFANDLVSRVKMLVKSGHTNIELLEMPEAKTKPDAVSFLKTTDYATNPLFASAIAEADEKYNTVKVGKAELSLDAIKSRNGIAV